MWRWWRWCKQRESGDGRRRSALLLLLLPVLLLRLILLNPGRHCHRRRRRRRCCCHSCRRCRRIRSGSGSGSPGPPPASAPLGPRESGGGARHHRDRITVLRYGSGSRSFRSDSLPLALWRLLVLLLFRSCAVLSRWLVRLLLRDRPVAAARRDGPPLRGKHELLGLAGSTIDSTFEPILKCGQVSVRLQANKVCQHTREMLY